MSNVLKYILLSVFFIFPIVSSATIFPFTPLEDKEYPTSTVALNFAQQNTIKTEKIQELPQELGRNPLALFSDVSEITGTQKIINLYFIPKALHSSVEIPQDFPLDVNEFVLCYLAGDLEKYEVPEDFGSLNGEIETQHGDVKYTIGSYKQTLDETPRSILDKLSQENANLYRKALVKVGKKNKDLWNFTREVLTKSDDEHIEGLNITNIKNLLSLLAFMYGGKVDVNPGEGVALKANIQGQEFIFPTNGKQPKPAYRKLIKQKTKDLLNASSPYHTRETYAHLFLTTVIPTDND